MIKKEEVKHVAKLARLGLPEKEIGKFQKELSSILDYVEKLKEVDVSGVEPTSHPLKVENVLRRDQGKAADLKMRKKLLALAPETKDNCIKVKSILR